MATGTIDTESLANRITAAVPTRGDDWRLFGRTLREVLARPRYALVAIGAAAVAITVFVLGQDYDLVRDFVVLGDLSLEDRLLFLLDLYPLVGPVYPLERAVLLYGIAGSIGINVAMVGYQFAELNLLAREGVGGGIGMVLGTVGAGCAACGTAVLGGVLSVFGVGSALALLPMDGAELLVVALVALVISAYGIARKIAGDAACPVELDGS